MRCIGQSALRTVSSTAAGGRACSKLASISMVAMICALVVAGCSASGPTKITSNFVPQPHLIDAAGTRSLQSQNASNKAVVTPLPRGDEALDVWLSAIASAEKTIAIKTFIYRPDAVGKVVAAHLFEAADRGVRVRVIVDDLFHFWKGHDLAFLDDHPGVSVRIFNPLDRNIPPPFNFLLEYDRVNPRMHNKALIADGRVAILGGRNVGAEYFRKSRLEYFSDFEVLVQGKAVEPLQHSFDAFWEDEYARDYRTIKPLRSGQSASLRREAKPGLTRPQPLEAVVERFASFSADVTTFADTPRKLKAPASSREYVAAAGVFGVLSNAQESVLITSPYFIPERYGTSLLSELAQRGVRVRVLTNSLGSTNHPSVHAGYVRYRKELLKAGVEIHEYRHDAAHEVIETGTRYAPATTLHSKVILIDGKTTIVGSMNFDPRSVRTNSELMVRLDSKPLNRWLQSWFEHTMKKAAYSLQLSQQGNVTWIFRGGDMPTSRESEPNHALTPAIMALIFGMLPMDSAL